IGLSRGETMGQSPTPVRNAPLPAPEELNAGKLNTPADRPTGRPRAEVGDASILRAELQSKTDKVAQLEDEQARLQRKFLATEHERDQLAANADQLGRKLEGREAELSIIRQQLADANMQDSEDAARLAALEQQVEDLNSNAGRKDQEIAREQELLEHD